jgi:dCTP deaminase
MILADFQIRALCAGEHQQMVAPFREDQLNPASYDLRLGDDLLIESAERPDPVAYPFAQHSEADPYLLRPGQFVLSSTVEVFSLPDDIAGQFLLKSSRAREGLEHLLAGYCDPGWSGSRLTLELHNSRQLHPVALWPGMKIGQVVFHRMDARPLRSYRQTGRYNDQPHVQSSLG